MLMQRIKVTKSSYMNLLHIFLSVCILMFWGATMQLAASSMPEDSVRSTCVTDAKSWISDLPAPHQKVILNHAVESCHSSANWMQKYASVTESQKRARMCNHLVLIWTHKKCTYFRRYFSYEAYSPCEKWARNQHDHCVAGDVSWFE